MTHGRCYQRVGSGAQCLPSIDPDGRANLRLTRGPQIVHEVASRGPEPASCDYLPCGRSRPSALVERRHVSRGRKRNDCPTEPNSVSPMTPANPPLVAKVQFLLRRAFSSPPDAIETHMSWVFLTDDRAYKLKKPVRHRFLDYRSLEARRLDTEAEVELNQALAPGVYLMTVPLTLERDGALTLDGGGEVVDWLVVMRRLPEKSMLEARITSGHASPGDLNALVGHLVAFYRSTDTVPTTPALYRRWLLATLLIDRTELSRPEYLIDQNRIRHLFDCLQNAVKNYDDLDGRAARIVDGHGDLRPEHIVVEPEPLVIDRITFDRTLRLVDPPYDLALLGVECELAGQPELSVHLAAAYVEEAGDPVHTATFDLYRSLRATSRARLSVAHLRDGEREAAKWLDRTDRYLAIAETNLAHFTSRADVADAPRVETQHLS